MKTIILFIMLFAAGAMADSAEDVIQDMIEADRNAPAFTFTDTDTNTAIYADAVMTNAVYQTHDSCSYKPCEICGKILYEWVGETFFNSGDVLYSGGFCFESNELAYEFYLPKSPICQACKDKYQAEFKAMIDNFYQSKREENKNLIKQHESEWKLKQMKKNQEKIDQLKKEIDELSK